MTTQTRNGLAVLAIAAFLIAYFVDWMVLSATTGSGLEINGMPMGLDGTSTFPGLPIAGLQIPVGAGTGQITAAGLQLDIWLIVTIALLGAVFGLISNLAPSALPRFAVIAPLAFAALFVASAFYSLTDAQVSLRPGLVAVTVGIALAAAAHLMPRAASDGATAR